MITWYTVYHYNGSIIAKFLFKSDAEAWIASHYPLDYYIETEHEVDK